MEDNIFDKVHEVDLEKTMKDSYIDYAMSVIASRALPDVRDGLKPVQRRVLYSMIELNNGPDKPHRKCARIVGDTMGKYHPHGDSSIYGALVNMAQEWSTRYPLVDGHGNFGSVDGDGAAAMRYTEARLSKISMEMLADINKDTVDFQPNFDETEREPVVLPSAVVPQEEGPFQPPLHAPAHRSPSSGGFFSGAGLACCFAHSCFAAASRSRMEGFFSGCVRSACSLAFSSSSPRLPLLITPSIMP